MKTCVPLYDAAGMFHGARSLASIHRLIAVDRVTVTRDRKGNIRRAFLRRADGKTSILQTAYLGTKYSYREHLRDGHSCYNLRKLGGNDPKGDDYLAPIFWTVVTSCIARPKLSHASTTIN
jgi:hypothetical protein